MTETELNEALRRDARHDNSDVRQRAARLLMERTGPAALELLVELAGDPDWRVRKAAIEALEANPTEAAVRALIPALSDPANAGKRNAAVEALRVFGARALPHLLVALSSAAEADTRIALANVVGEIPSEESSAALIGLLSDPDVNVAAAAIVALGRLGRREAIPSLIAVLTGENAWLHYHAIEALGKLRAVEALPAIVACDANPALKKAILEAAGSIGGFGAIDLLASRLTSARIPDFALLRAFVTVDGTPRPAILANRERAYLRRKFRESVPPEAAAVLTVALKKTERADRKADVLRALGWMGVAGVIPLLVAHLGGEQSEAAERALEDIGGDAEEALLDLLSPTADEQKIEIALRLLLRWPSARQLFPVLALLEHDSPLVRRAAVDALGRLADARALDYLLAHLGDGDAGVDTAAAEAALAVTAGDVGARRSLEARASRACSSSDPLVRANALALLFETRSEDFRACVATASKDEDAVVRARAVGLAGRAGDPSLDAVLQHGLTDESPLVRQAAVFASAPSGDPARAARIAALLEDDDLWVRSAACRSLGAAKAVAFAGRLVEIAGTGEPPERIAALEALGKIGVPEGWSAIRAALDDADGELRQAALAAAAELDTAEAAAEIDRRIEDPDWRLRATALESLGRRGRRDRRTALRRSLLGDPDDLVARSALGALETLAGPDDVPTLVAGLSREAIAEDICRCLARIRPRFGREIERAWREADSRVAAILAEILRSDATP